MNHAFDAESRTDSPLGERVHDPVAREVADDEQQPADDDEGDADGTQRLPTPALGEVDREAEEQEDGDGEEDRQLADELDDGLHRTQLIRPP